MKNIKKELIEQDKICYLCGEAFVNPKAISVDHAIPKVKIQVPLRYNTHGLENMLLTHAKCNFIKGNDSIFVAVKKINYLKESKGDKFLKWVNTIWY